MANKISNFEPEDELLRIPNYVLKDILKNGVAYMPLPNGKIQKITKEDLLFKVDEIEEYLSKIGNQNENKS